MRLKAIFAACSFGLAIAIVIAGQVHDANDLQAAGLVGGADDCGFLQGGSCDGTGPVPVPGDDGPAAEGDADTAQKCPQPALLFVSSTKGNLKLISTESCGRHKDCSKQFKEVQICVRVATD